MEEQINNTQKNKIIFYTQKYKFIILTVFLLLITVGVTATGLYFFSKDFLNSKLQNIQNQDGFVVRSVSLSDEQKQEIYKKMLKRNATILDNLNTTAQSENSGPKNIDTRFATSLSREFTFVKGFTKTTTQYKIGNKQCKAIFDKDNVYGKLSTSLTYVDKDKFYSKYLYEDAESGFLDLTISNTDYKNRISFNIFYKGGNYAVKYDTSSNMSILNEDVPQEVPAPMYEQSDEEVTENNIDITRYIGPNADIVGETDYNGTRVYVIRYSDNVNCDDINFTSTDKPHKLVHELFVEQNEFAIVRNATYLDSISPQNLVYEFITSNEFKDVNFEEVKKLFDFDLNVEIKEFKEPKYDSKVIEQKRKDYFNTLSFHFLKPTEGNINNLYASLYENEIPEYQKYLESREFFPKGKLGDELYKKYGPYNKDFVNKILNYSMDVGDLRWNFYLLDSKSVNEVIEKNFKNEGSDVQSIDKVNLKISGDNIEATRIKHSYQVYSLAPIGSTPEPMPKTIEYAFLFLYKGNLYEISVTKNNYSNDGTSEFGVDISNYSLSAFGKDTIEFKALSDAIFNNSLLEPVGIDNVKTY